MSHPLYLLYLTNHFNLFIIQELSFLFGGGAQKSESSSSIVQKTETYKVPDGRSIGRPHSTGWLDLLEEDRVDNKDIYEADNWREVNKAET